MEFFATGGFQQLFSDLNEQQVEATLELTSTLEHDNQTASVDSCCQQYDVCAVGVCQYGGAQIMNAAELSSKDAAELYDSCNYYEVLHLEAKPRPSKQNGDHLLDYNNNVSLLCNSEQQQLQHSLDLLLPQAGQHHHDNMDTYTELYANAFITSEVAEWEEKFLDNYIEIPELIDFLPEKTPLCTEMCELFLHESSQNLQLSGKSKYCATLNTASCKSPDEKCFPCNFGDCQKIYAKPAHLKAHLRRHLGEKPYICNWAECTWRFSRSDELARHRRSHSGVKPYKCVYCTKGFARSDHLTKHRKVHERRMLAASKEGKTVDGVLPPSVFTVRPGRKRKNQSC